MKKTAPALSVALVASVLAPFARPVLGQTTAFTYQSALNDGGNPANGLYGATERQQPAASPGHPAGRWGLAQARRLASL